MGENLILSTLPKTWILDLDGTIVKHNGYKTDGVDSLLEGAREYLASIPEEDFVLFLTSRTEEYRDKTVNFLRDNNIRYNAIMFDIPMGERIVINDRKPSGIDMAVAINVDRNEALFPSITRVR